MLIVGLEQLRLSSPRASELRTGDFQFIDDPFRDEVTIYLVRIDGSPAEWTGEDMLQIFMIFAELLKAGLAKSMPKLYMLITHSAISWACRIYRSKWGISASMISL